MVVADYVNLLAPTGVGPVKTEVWEPGRLDIRPD